MTVGVAGGRTGDLAGDLAVGEARGQVGTDDDGFWSDGPLSAALLAVVGGVDALAADLTVPGTGETLDALRGVERQIRRLQGVSVRLVGQVEQRGLVAPAGATSTVALLQQVLQLGAGDAADRVRLSRAVCATVGLTGAPVEPQLPGLAGAVAAGAVGQRQAARLAATFDKFPSTISQDSGPNTTTSTTGQTAAPPTTTTPPCSAAATPSSTTTNGKSASPPTDNPK